jgi:hypothetical protein
MRVELWLQKLSQPIVFKKALSTYEKGAFFCILVGKSVQDRRSQEVYKYPMNTLFRVKESY